MCSFPARRIRSCPGSIELSAPGPNDAGCFLNCRTDRTAMTNISRREFLGTTAATAAVFTSKLYAAGSDQPARDRPPARLALMGVHSRGKQLLKTLLNFSDVEVVYL